MHKTMSLEVMDGLGNLKTIRDFIRWGASRFKQAELFFGHGTDNALDEAVFLVLDILHLDHDLPPHFLDAQLTADERKAVINILTRRVTERCPAAQLTHKALFAGMSFYVNDWVLVPRSPIAELIRQDFLPWASSLVLDNILDLCTGSGCIGIACADQFAQAQVDLVDISPEALKVAQINLDKHGLSHQVRVIESDLFDGLTKKRYDLIVSNPPYVSVEEMTTLPEEYHQEPELGLVAGEDGLDLVRRILAEAVHYLTPEGLLIVEVGNTEITLIEAFPEVPFLWLNFEFGGHGVFILTAKQLNEYFAHMQ